MRLGDLRMLFTRCFTQGRAIPKSAHDRKETRRCPVAVCHPAPPPSRMARPRGAIPRPPRRRGAPADITWMRDGGPPRRGATRVPPRSGPPEANAVERVTIFTSSCAGQVVIRDADSGELLARIESVHEPAQHLPPKTLQSSYEDYLARYDRPPTHPKPDEVPSAAVGLSTGPAEPMPRTARVVYGIPATHRRVQIEEGSTYGGVIPVPVGGSHHAEAFAIVSAVALLLAVISTGSRHGLSKIVR
jgi:hypothetical protein